MTSGDLENVVKVNNFEFGLCLALVLLCTKFGEDMSNISPDIEWKASCIRPPDRTTP